MCGWQVCAMHWASWIFCLSLSFCCVEGTIRSDAQAVVGRVGESAVLPCSLLQDAGRPPLYVIEWVRFGFILPIFIKFGLFSPRVDPQYLGRSRIEEGASLQIDSLRSDDQGWYECRVLFLDRHHADEDFKNGTWIHLTVNSPPSFIETPPIYVEVRVGDSLTLTCVANGNPQPVVSWKQDNVNVANGDKIQVYNGSLRIMGVQRSHAGAYTCHAASEEGEVTHTSRVLVQGPPVIVVPPENITVNVSQDAFLTCQAEAYPTNLTYSWFHGNSNVYLLSRLQSRVRILVDGSFLLQQVIPEDSGKYTCIPSNGMWKSPSASAYLTVLHPAYVTDMPTETFLPVGMRGVIRCPARANPPLLFVNWTKDGNPLDLDKFPGWHLQEDGSIMVATSNDDAPGTYTCTPYNSYGTTGMSLPTVVILKDPPSFIDLPKDEYFQDVGRELIVPCSATGDPPPIISWTKLGLPGKSIAQMDVNGSLVFRPLTKEEHGEWECTAANNVASISALTTIFVLGTSPHTVSNVSAQPLVSAVNISWVAGFDGGYFQRFSVWVKRLSHGHHEWISLSAPVGASSLVVENLQADSPYQFSVLSQNKLGSGPFSEIVTATPLSVPPTTLPPPVPTTDSRDTLTPPRFLAANETSRGVLLTWAPPLRSLYPLRAYGLECRRDEGDWELLDDAILTTQSELLVPGLVKDASYEFRLVAFAGDYISDPSNSVNISTAGMKVYPSQTEHPEVQQKSLMAGVVGGICFLTLAIILSTIVACLMNRRRARRRRKRRQQDAPMVFSQPKKASPSQNTNGSNSPDSLVRLKLQVSPYESFRKSLHLGEKTVNNLSVSHGSATSGRYTIYESNVGECVPLERISRGPDGRFVVETDTRPNRGSIRGFPYVTETDLYPEFNARDSSDLSQCSQAKTYLQVCQLPERPLESWRDEVKMRPKATGQARKEARDSGYRQGKYFGCSSSPLEEAKPFRIPDISPVTSTAALPYSQVEEARCGESAQMDGELERTISTLRESETDCFSSLSTIIRAPSLLLQKPLVLSDQASQLRHSLSTQSGILQYLSLPFFKEMSVDGDWPGEDEAQTRSSEASSSETDNKDTSNNVHIDDRTLMDVDGTSGVRKEESPCAPHQLLSLDYLSCKQEQSVPVKSFLKPPEPNLGPAKAILPGSLMWTQPPENAERLKVGQRAHWDHGNAHLDSSRLGHHNSSHFDCPLKDHPLSVFTDFHALEKQRPPVDRSLFFHGSEKVMRSSLTSQSSGRGSVSFLRPPSLAQSVGGSYLNSPLGETSSWYSGGGSQGSSAEDYRHRKDSLLATVSNRRNTSVDENYEWDSEFTLEVDLLDALQVYRNGNSGQTISTISVGEVERQNVKLPSEAAPCPAGSGPVDALDSRYPQALSSPEERCAALKEEFLEYQRRRQAAQKIHTRNKDYEECFEQATLL